MKIDPERPGENFHMDSFNNSVLIITHFTLIVKKAEQTVWIYYFSSKLDIPANLTTT